MTDKYENYDRPFKITVIEKDEKPKDFIPTESNNLINDLPYRLSMFVSLLIEVKEIKAVDFVELLCRKGVFIYRCVGNDGTRELRKMKEELIDLGFPIGSSGGKRCYFWITNSIGEKAACNEYIKRAKTELQRANKIKENVRNYYKRTPGPDATLFQIEERKCRG